MKLRAELVDQTLDPLISASEMNLLHRDIKPSNIMMTWQPSGRFQVKLLDFGLAKFSQQPSLQTLDQSGSFLGSIDYIAPEQVEVKPLDQRTDLYSLGCVYYFALTQTPPFSGDSVAETMTNHLSHKVIPLAELRPDLPTAITAWVMSLISRKTEDRPANAMAAREAFSSAQEQAKEEPPHEKTPIAVPVAAASPLTQKQVTLETTQHQVARPLHTKPVEKNPASTSKAFKRRIATGPQLYTNSLPGRSESTRRYEPVHRTPITRKLLIAGVVAGAVIGGIVIASLSGKEKTTPLTPQKIAENPPKADPPQPKAKSQPNKARPSAPPPKIEKKAPLLSNTRIAPEGTENPPFASRLIASYPLAGGILDPNGKRLSQPGQPIGAIQNRVSTAAPEHLLIARPNQDRSPHLIRGPGGKDRIRFPFGTQVGVSSSVVQNEVLIADQLALAMTIRVDQKMGGHLGRFLLKGEKGPIHFRFSHFNGKLMLISEQGKNKSSCQLPIPPNREVDVILHWDGKKGKQQIFARLPDGSFKASGLVNSIAKGRLPLNGYDFGFLNVPKPVAARKNS